MKEVYLTQEGLEELKQRLDYLIVYLREDVAQKLQHARELGDLSENAEYDAAKQEESQVASEIKDLEGRIKNAVIIEKSGTWYSYKGERLGQGKENVKIFMKEHPEITDEVEKIIRDTLAAEPEKFDEAMEEEDTAALETPDTPAAGSDEA